MAGYQIIKFSAASTLLEWLQEEADILGCSKSVAAKKDLEALSELLGEELARFTRDSPFTLAEMEVIARALDGPTSARPSWPTGRVCNAVADATQVIYVAPGEAPPNPAAAALVAKLASMSAAADMALGRAVARWRKLRLDHTVEAWTRVGVHVIDEAQDESQRCHMD